MKQQVGRKEGSVRCLSVLIPDHSLHVLLEASSALASLPQTPGNSCGISLPLKSWCSPNTKFLEGWHPPRARVGALEVWGVGKWDPNVLLGPLRSFRE